MTTVYVCPERDIECGRNPATWCATCPQRATTQPREQADERALFEADMRGHGHTDNDLISRLGWYKDQRVQDKWMGWQAKARAIAPVAAPEAPTLPTNDEVYAEVNRLRGARTGYVSTNAVNDTMQAVRSLLAPLVPEVAASEQPCSICAVDPMLCSRHIPAATTASASREALTEYLMENFAIGQENAEWHAAYIIANKVRATAPSRNAAPVGPALRDLTRAVVERLGWTINGTFVVTKSGEMLHTADGIAFVHAALTQQSAAQAPSQEADSEPDMLWLTEDPEVFANGPDDFAADYADNCLMLGEQAEVVVDCAYRGSKRTMRIVVAKDEDAENRVSWEWVAAMSAATEQGEKP